MTESCLYIRVKLQFEEFKRSLPEYILVHTMMQMTNALHGINMVSTAKLWQIPDLHYCMLILLYSLKKTVSFLQSVEVSNCRETTSTFTPKTNRFLFRIYVLLSNYRQCEETFDRRWFKSNELLICYR